MWLSKTMALRQAAGREDAATDMGVTTIGGGSASVMTRGEQRELAVFSPGGVIWQPLAGDTVLVVKGGMGAQEQCIVAADTAADTPKGMLAGELFLYSTGGASIHLRNNGSIAVKGPVSVEGDLTVKGNTTLTGQVSILGTLIINGEPYRPCRCS